MEHFVESLAIHRLGKEVKEFLKKLEHPKCSDGNDLKLRFDQLYKDGKITKEDYLFAYTRILLNQFCYNIEEVLGKGAMAGFLFYCKEKHKLYFGAGANYPITLKGYLQDRTPTVNMHGYEQYKNEVFVLDDVHEWKPEDDKQNYKSVFVAHTDVRTLVSKRLRKNDFTFGTFECYFTEPNAVTGKDIDYICESVQPIKDQLYHLRTEMIETLQDIQKKAIS